MLIRGLLLAALASGCDTIYANGFDMLTPTEADTLRVRALSQQNLTPILGGLYAARAAIVGTAQYQDWPEGAGTPGPTALNVTLPGGCLTAGSQIRIVAYGQLYSTAAVVKNAAVQLDLNYSLGPSTPFSFGINTPAAAGAYAWRAEFDLAFSPNGKDQLGGGLFLSGYAHADIAKAGLLVDTSQSYAQGYFPSNVDPAQPFNMVVSVQVPGVGSPGVRILGGWIEAL